MRSTRAYSIYNPATAVLLEAFVGVAFGDRRYDFTAGDGRIGESVERCGGEVRDVFGAGEDWDDEEYGRDEEREGGEVHSAWGLES